MSKYRDLNPRYNNDPATLQRLVEGQNLDTRIFLNKYKLPIEGQRNRIQTYRQTVIDVKFAGGSELEPGLSLCGRLTMPGGIIFRSRGISIWLALAFLGRPRSVSRIYGVHPSGIHRDGGSVASADRAATRGGAIRRRSRPQ